MDIIFIFIAAAVLPVVSLIVRFLLEHSFDFYLKDYEEKDKLNMFIDFLTKNLIYLHFTYTFIFFNLYLYTNCKDIKFILLSILPICIIFMSIICSMNYKKIFDKYLKKFINNRRERIGKEILENYKISEQISNVLGFLMLLSNIIILISIPFFAKVLSFYT